MKTSFLLPFALLALCGCNFRPSRVELPEFQPAEVAARAIQAYDTNADSKLSSKELAASPALNSALPELDTNSDKQLDASELTARMQAWLERQSALVLLPVKVQWQGKPLEGAEVRFVPDPFLGETYGVATGTTDEFGVANLEHAPEFRPDPDFPQGVKVGFYRIEITSAGGKGPSIPAKYNEQTVLGQEVSPLADGMNQGVLTLDL